MKNHRLNLILAIGAVVLLAGTLAAGVWPVKSKHGVACGSFLSASSTVYQDASRHQFNMLNDVTSDRALGMPTGTLASVADEVANYDVESCDARRQKAGIVAGAILLLALAMGSAFFILRQRENTTPAG